MKAHGKTAATVASLWVEAGLDADVVVSEHCPPGVIYILTPGALGLDENNQIVCPTKEWANRIWAGRIEVST